MCQNCSNSSCRGCAQPCYQFPPPLGTPGQVGPIGPQGPPGTPGTSPVFSIVNLVSNANFPQTAYSVDGSEDALLIDNTIGQSPLSTFDVYLLPANDPNAAKRALRVKDAFNQASIHDIRIIPDGTDTIDGINAPKSLFLTVGSGGSLTFITNKTTGYNIV